jgi:hypothetical protein
LLYFSAIIFSVNSFSKDNSSINQNVRNYKTYLDSIDSKTAEAITKSRDHLLNLSKNIEDKEERYDLFLLFKAYFLFFNDNEFSNNNSRFNNFYNSYFVKKDKSSIKLINLYQHEDSKILDSLTYYFCYDEGVNDFCKFVIDIYSRNDDLEFAMRYDNTLDRRGSWNPKPNLTYLLDTKHIDEIKQAYKKNYDQFKEKYLTLVDNGIIPYCQRDSCLFTKDTHILTSLASQLSIESYIQKTNLPEYAFLKYNLFDDYTKPGLDDGGTWLSCHKSREASLSIVEDLIIHSKNDGYQKFKDVLKDCYIGCTFGFCDQTTAGGDSNYGYYGFPPFEYTSYKDRNGKRHYHLMDSLLAGYADILKKNKQYDDSVYYIIIKKVNKIWQENDYAYSKEVRKQLLDVKKEYFDSNFVGHTHIINCEDYPVGRCSGNGV